MRLKSLALGAVLGCLCLSAAVAQEEPQVVRQNLMKGIGQSMGALGAIAKGEKPYDAAVVQTSLETISTLRSPCSAIGPRMMPSRMPAGEKLYFCAR